MTGNKTGTHRANRKKDIDRSVIDGAVNSTSDDVLKLSTILTSTVIDSLSKLGSPREESLNETVVPKNLVGGWTQVNRSNKAQASPPKLNVPSIVRKSIDALAAQSTPKNVRPSPLSPGIENAPRHPNNKIPNLDALENLGNQLRFVTTLS